MPFRRAPNLWLTLRQLWWNSYRIRSNIMQTGKIVKFMSVDPMYVCLRHSHRFIWIFSNHSFHFIIRKWSVLVKDQSKLSNSFDRWNNQRNPFQIKSIAFIVVTTTFCCLVSQHMNCTFRWYTRWVFDFKLILRYFLTVISESFCSHSEETICNISCSTLFGRY